MFDFQWIDYSPGIRVRIDNLGHSFNNSHLAPLYLQNRIFYPMKRIRLPQAFLLAAAMLLTALGGCKWFGSVNPLLDRVVGLPYFSYIQERARLDSLIGAQGSLDEATLRKVYAEFNASRIAYEEFQEAFSTAFGVLPKGPKLPPPPPPPCYCHPADIIAYPSTDDFDVKLVDANGETIGFSKVDSGDEGFVFLRPEISADLKGEGFQLQISSNGSTQIIPVTVDIQAIEVRVK
jgi:hypothetical protein